MSDNDRGRHDVVVDRRLPMHTRDGTRLVADVYRPATGAEPLPGRFPAVLVRTPYETHGSSQPTNGAFFAAHGYLYVVQDVRGRQGSDGAFELLANEHLDGHDAVEWVAALPFCDGNVGTQGTSLRGWNQVATALTDPPHLRCMWINHAGFDGRSSAVRHNGAFELRWLAWAVVYALEDRRIAASPTLRAEQIAHGRDLLRWLRRLPWDEGDSPLANLPDWERWALAFYRGADDDALWDDPNRDTSRFLAAHADVPTMHAGSWYDAYALATIRRFTALKDRLEHQYLLMGPGIHGGASFDASTAGDVEFGPAAPIAGNLAASRLHLMLRWFDRWLRGADVNLGPRVRIFVTGTGDGGRDAVGRLVRGGAWRAEADWPLPDADALTLHLQPGGRLGAEPVGAEAASSTFVFDPSDPLPSVAGNVSSLNELVAPPPGVGGALDAASLKRSLMIQGGADQVSRADLHHRPPHGQPLADRGDVVTFTTAPLDDDLEVTGEPVVVVHLSSDAPDTDVFVLLIDLHPASSAWPTGFRLNVCDGLVRARYRDSLTDPRLLDGSVVEVRVPLSPTSTVFRRGHRIQVLVSSSSFPRFDVNPNTGEPVGRHTRTQVATNTIHHDRTHPSRLLLPIVARG